MNGILGEVGKALATLQEFGEVIIEKTDVLYPDEITYCVEEVLYGVKAAYIIEEIKPNVRLKITLQ